MRKTLQVTTLVVCVLLATVLQAQDKVQDKAKKKPGRLPTGWSKIIKLDKQQQQKLRAIDLKARDEIEKLNEQIRQVRVKARQDHLAVLTPEQRKKLKAALVGEEGGDGKDGKNKDKGK